jgi:hypothetical protein
MDRAIRNVIRVTATKKLGMSINLWRDFARTVHGKKIAETQALKQIFLKAGEVQIGISQRLDYLRKKHFFRQNEGLHHHKR